MNSEFLRFSEWLQQVLLIRLTYNCNQRQKQKRVSLYASCVNRGHCSRTVAAVSLSVFCYDFTSVAILLAVFFEISPPLGIARYCISASWRRSCWHFDNRMRVMLHAIAIAAIMLTYAWSTSTRMSSGAKSCSWVSAHRLRNGVVVSGSSARVTSRGATLFRTTDYMHRIITMVVLTTARLLAAPA